MRNYFGIEKISKNFVEFTNFFFMGVVLPNKLKYQNYDHHFESTILAIEF